MSTLTLMVIWRYQRQTCFKSWKSLQKNQKSLLINLALISWLFKELYKRRKTFYLRKDRKCSSRWLLKKSKKFMSKFTSKCERIWNTSWLNSTLSWRISTKLRMIKRKKRIGFQRRRSGKRLWWRNTIINLCTQSLRTFSIL